MKPDTVCPDLHAAVFVSGSGQEIRYWASLFRNGSIERNRGPFMTADAAQVAFSPIKVWPKPQRKPNA